MFIKELCKRDKMRGLLSILSLFRNEFNKFNDTEAQMIDSIYHLTLRYIKICILGVKVVKVLIYLTQHYNRSHYIRLQNL